MIVRRGEIFFVVAPNHPKPRPAVVLTADWLSRYALDVTVVPITGVPRPAFPTRVELSVGEGGLRKTSWAKCDQATTIPKTCLQGLALGRLSSTTMKGIEDAVRLALGL